MSNPTNKGIGGDNEKEEKISFKDEDVKEAVTAGLSPDDIGVNAKAGELSNPANPINNARTPSPQDIKDVNDASRYTSASGNDQEAAIKQYNDALSGAGDGRIAGTMFEHTAKSKREADSHKHYVHDILAASGNIFANLENTLDDLENTLNEADKALDDVSQDVTLTIYELEEQQNDIQALLDEQRQELEELRNGTSLLLQGESPDSEMGKAQIALKEAEIENTESRLRLVETTLELTQTQLKETQEAQTQARIRIEEIKAQIEAAKAGGENNTSDIEKLELELSEAKAVLQQSTNKIEALQTRTELNRSIIELSQEAKAVSETCGVNASVEIEKAHDINANTALINKLTDATADGKLSKEEIDELKANFDSARISEAAQQSFIKAYVDSGGSVGVLDENNNEVFLEGDEASAALAAQLNIEIAETEKNIAEIEAKIADKSSDITHKQSDIIDAKKQVSRADNILEKSSERSIQLADAIVDQELNQSLNIGVIKDFNGNEVYINRGISSADDTFYYIDKETGEEIPYDSQKDALQIANFKALASGPQMSPITDTNSVGGLTSAFNLTRTQSTGLLANIGLQSSTPSTPQRFANETVDLLTYRAMAEKDIASDQIKADEEVIEQIKTDISALMSQGEIQKESLEKLQLIKDQVESGNMSKEDAEIAIDFITAERDSSATSTTTQKDGEWNGQDGMALKTSVEMQLALQDVYQKIENKNISREDLDQALGADASPELKQQIEAALERDGVEIKEPDEPDNGNNTDISTNNDLTVSYPLVGIGPFKVNEIKPPQVQPASNGVLPAVEYKSFADNEFNNTNPEYTAGHEPTYVAQTNNGTDNVPAAGETFALAQANQLNNNTPSSQGGPSADDIIRLQREAELRLAENSMNPANQGGGAGGAI